VLVLQQWPLVLLLSLASQPVLLVALLLLLPVVCW
jgi:hypothetical protein